ncbi:protein NODULATION SIGNALING PATHWAY 2-like [Fagus crenata]
MAIDITLDLNHSGYSTTTTTATTVEDVYGCDWQNWPQVVDWESFQLQGHDDFQDLIDSMMDDGALVLALGATAAMEVEVIELEGSLGSSNSNSNSNSESTDMIVTDVEETNEDCKGLRLVHLLLAAAEALGVNKSRDLAGVILVRLKELVSTTDGTNMV